MQIEAIKRQDAPAAVSGAPRAAGKKKDRAADIVCRPATPADGRDMWRFVQAAGVLELNPSYAYILICQHFGNTCLVAEKEGRMVGFVLAYVPPRQPDTVFVWQIGVAREVRGQGVGHKLLHHLLALDGCRKVTYLEASVTPSNTPSQNLFRAFARKKGVPCRKLPFFPADFFPDDHEPEHLYRLGPLEWPEA
ncbi:MAG: diaminobutyrate acetyltransferase [Halofilum sp. (in: g-proteobacteria)]|nr:diaminobutyrate acetyltransferase [Halofilum sp. (in: g-proteobacteria)]